MTRQRRGSEGNVWPPADPGVIPSSPALPLDPTAIRDLRKRLALTQERFAQELGVTFVTVNRWEAGTARPQHAHLAKLHVLAGTFERQALIQAAERSSLAALIYWVGCGHSPYATKVLRIVAKHLAEVTASEGAPPNTPLSMRVKQGQTRKAQ